jgi:hypothetical protein
VRRCSDPPAVDIASAVRYPDRLEDLRIRGHPNIRPKKAVRHIPGLGVRDLGCDKERHRSLAADPEEEGSSVGQAGEGSCHRAGEAHRTAATVQNCIAVAEDTKVGHRRTPDKKIPKYRADVEEAVRTFAGHMAAEESGQPVHAAADRAIHRNNLTTAISTAVPRTHRGNIVTEAPWELGPDPWEPGPDP